MRIDLPSVLVIDELFALLHGLHAKKGKLLLRKAWACHFSKDDPTVRLAKPLSDH
jgi:hypothetical protein